MHAAVALVISFAFEQLGVHRVSGMVQFEPQNKPALRVLDKLGFAYEGRSRSFLRTGTAGSGPITTGARPSTSISRPASSATSSRQPGCGQPDHCVLSRAGTRDRAFRTLPDLGRYGIYSAFETDSRSRSRSPSRRITSTPFLVMS